MKLLQYVQVLVTFDMVYNVLRLLRKTVSEPSSSPTNCQPRKAPVRTGAGAGSGSEKLWEALVQSEVRFNKVAEKVPEKVWEAFVQNMLGWTASGEGSTEGLGGFGAKKVPRRFQDPRRSGQGQVRFNSVPKKVPEKVPESLGAEPSQVQRFRRRFGKSDIAADGDTTEAYLIRLASKCYRHREPPQVVRTCDALCI